MLLALPSFPLASEPASEYSILLAKVKAGDTGIDFGRLRLSYADSPERTQAKDTADSQKGMLDALNARDFSKALKNAMDVLDAEYVDTDAHFVAFEANRELGDTAKASFHRAVFRGLVKSIQDSGDGRSPEKAWVVVSVHEEYVLIRVLGCQPVSHSLLVNFGDRRHNLETILANFGEDAAVIPEFRGYGACHRNNGAA